MTPARRTRVAAAVALFLGTVALLLATTSDLGYARDEGFYFHASRTYGDWLLALFDDRAGALRQEVIDAHFQVNAEHPPLMKLLFAASHLVLGSRWGLFDEPGTAFRFPAMVVAALLVAGVYGRASRHGHAAGAVAALSLLFMPRFFYHAHLACFDVPIVAMFFFTCLAYERALATRGATWPVVTGLCFGLALATKHNSWFLPITFGAHALLAGLVAHRTGGSFLVAARRSAACLGAMAAIGPLLLIALWPWLWHDPAARFLEYARFHLEHDYYNMELLGRNYFRPPMPRSYAPLMTAATVPLVTLALGVLGVVAAGRGLAGALLRRAPGGAARSSALLWALAIGASYGAWLSSDTPIFGGTKHWMTAYPFFALFAAAGFVAAGRRAVLLVRGVRGTPRWRLAWASLAALVVASPAYQAIHAHPFALTAYTPLVGGAAGAASLGLNRSFWGYTTGAVVEYLNREVPKNGKVYIHDTSWPSWQMLIADGRLRADLRGVGSAGEADFALYHHEMHMQGEEYQAWIAFESVAPEIVRGLDGVPVVMVYRRRGPPSR